MTDKPASGHCFIEESFPVKELGEASAREKNIRHGHISTLHIWCARRRGSDGCRCIDNLQGGMCYTMKIRQQLIRRG